MTRNFVYLASWFLRCGAVLLSTSFYFLFVTTRLGAQEHLAPVIYLKLLSGSEMVSIHENGTLCDWKLKTDSKTGGIVAQFVKSRSNAMPAGDQVVAILEPKNKIEFRYLKTGNVISRLSYSDGVKSITHVAFSTATKSAAIGSADGSVRLYRDVNKEPKLIANPYATPKVPHETARLTFTPDGSRLLVLSCPVFNKLRMAVGIRPGLEAYYMTVYDIERDRFSHQFDQDDKFGLYDSSISPNGKYLGSANQLGTGYLWDFQTGQRIVTFSKQDVSLINLWFADEGHSLIFGTHNGAASIWEVATGKERLYHRTGQEWVTAACQSKMLLATGSADGSIKVWNLPQLVLDKGTLAKRTFDAKDLDFVWTQLNEEDPKEAFKGVLTMAYHAKIFVGWLNEKLPSITKKDVEAYIAALDHESFAEREKAMKTLMSLSPFFQSELEKSRDGTSSPEVKNRIGLILDKSRDESKRYVRLIEAMEICDLPEASTILERIAALGGFIGSEAENARKRIQKRQPGTGE
jgi:WD40 repeat protein